MLKRVRWRVGNGVRINCFEDPWLPKPTSFKPYTKEGSDLRLVYGLFLVQGEIDSLFLPADGEVIKSTPLSFVPTKDKQI